MQAKSQKQTQRSKDAVAAAISIVQQKSGSCVDWSREPLTERERAIRKRVLEKKSRGRILPSWSIAYLTSARMGELGHPDPCDRRLMPSDVRAAFDEAERRDEEKRLRDRQREIEDAAREVDGLQPLEDDYFEDVELAEESDDE